MAGDEPAPMDVPPAEEAAAAPAKTATLAGEVEKTLCWSSPRVFAFGELPEPPHSSMHCGPRMLGSVFPSILIRSHGLTLSLCTLKEIYPPTAPLTLHSLTLPPAVSSELKKNIALLERAVQTTQLRLIGRVLRGNLPFRTSLPPAQLAEAIKQSLHPQNGLRDKALEILAQVRRLMPCFCMRQQVIRGVLISGW
jgi:hypothetical protein